MSTGRRSVAVVGNSLAAMMAALTLAEREWAVCLVSPTPRLGGHFAGLEFAGRTFDAGMVYLEFTSFNAEPRADLSTYDPERRNDVGRFFPIVEQTLARFGSWRKVETPQMRIGDGMLPDLFIANQLSSLSALPSEIRERMTREVTLLAGAGRGPFHPSRKTVDPSFVEYDFEKVSLANHGSTFHERFIEPFCRKLTAQPTSLLLALYHRLAWLPLFHPETLLLALRGEPTHLADTVFAYPTHGTVASLVHKVEHHLRSHASIRIVEGKVNALSPEAGGAVSIGVTGGPPMTADRLVWASDRESLLELAGQRAAPGTDRASLTLVSVLARSDEIETPSSTLLIPDDVRLPFRVTNQSVASGESASHSRISCEFNTSYAENEPALQASRTKEALVELRIVRRLASVSDMRVDVFKGALQLPTRAALAHVVERRRLLQSLLPSVPCIGPAAPLGATSFNDQIIQGLKVGHELGETT